MKHMKYNNVELQPITQDEWDGKERAMLVWNSHSAEAQKRTVYGVIHGIWFTNCNGVSRFSQWEYCAEIPDTRKPEHEQKVEPNEEVKVVIDATYDEIRNAANADANLEWLDCSSVNLISIVFTNDMAVPFVVQIYRLHDEYRIMSVTNAHNGMLALERRVRNLVHSYITNAIKKVAEKKPARYATHRELSEWCAKGNGEWATKNTRYGYMWSPLTTFNYVSGEEDIPLNKRISPRGNDETVLVRKWKDTEWVDPTVDYMGIE